jgi:hypothetical protein
MEDFTPRVIDNCEFTGYEEADIKRLNKEEAEKFELSPEFKKASDHIEEEMGKRGHWEEHWMAVDNSGKRIYARVYSNAAESVAVSSDGRIVQKLVYPDRGEERLH